MKRLHKLSYGLSLLIAAILLVCSWVTSRPSVQLDQYASIHTAATMAPLTGFSKDSMVNTGDAKALDALPGVGKVIAERMLQMREMLGGFRLPEDLLLVKGIGSATMKKIVDALEEPLVMLPELSE